MKTFLFRFKLLFVLLGMLACVILFGELIPIEIKSFFYATSISIKNLIIFFLPVIIFVFLCGSLITLQSQAAKFVILLLLLVTISNFLAILAGYVASISILPTIDFKVAAINNSLQLTPAWNLIFPELVSTKAAIIVSIVIGLFFAFKPNPMVSRIADKLNQGVIYFFKHYFTPILPLFILGFLLKLEHDKVLSHLVIAYGPILLLMVMVQFLYIILMFLLSSEFRLKLFWEQIKNLIPASITAFSTMSSAATLPITLMCTERNLKDPAFARLIVPATCNIHALGSAIGLPILALATLQAFNYGLPDFKHFLDFAIYYTIAKYAVAGVPGGVVVVAAPLLEAYLGLTPEMVGVVTAIYLLFDTFGTMTNVTCNGAFAIIFSKVYESKLVKKILK